MKNIHTYQFTGIAIMLLMMYDFKDPWYIILMFLSGYALAVWGHYLDKE